jgi:acetyl esterase/lipase
LKNASLKAARLPYVWIALAFVLITSQPKRAAAQSQAPVAASASEPTVFTYREIDGRALKAYVFRPQTSAKTHPAILLFHGGAWQLGDASWMFDRAKEFAHNGLVAIAIDYTLSNNGHSPIDGVEDACAAFRWARLHSQDFGIDTGKVAGYGVSAGGHLVAAAATLSSVRDRKLTADERPNAMLLYSPALNMAKDPYFMRLMNGKGDPAGYSPAEYISHALPPTLIIQGEEDTIVFAKDARSFCEAAIKKDTRCELHVYPNVGHLLTRNLKVQYKDFDSDPADAAEAHRLEDEFLRSLGYMQR